MGRLENGVWDGQKALERSDGSFRREATTFREPLEGLTDGGSLEPDRYILIVSPACPWAHRTLIARALGGLDEIIPIVTVLPDMLENGWVLPESSHAPGPFPGKRYLHEVYTMADPRFTGRVTVPLLWDVRRGTIANNESGDILRAFGGAWSQTGVNLYPQALSDEIDLMNARVYEDINNGVYKCGFATTQQAYDRAAKALFRAMDALEKHLSDRTYLVGEVLTEADIRLFTTMIRFDVVYHVHFKCCRKRLVDYPALLRHTARLFERPDIRQTVSIAAIRRHYFYSHKDINPHRIVPLAPANGVGLS